MSILHSEPVAPAFGRLLKKKLEPDDYVLLAHLFEEISVLALHHLIPKRFSSTRLASTSIGMSCERTSCR